MLTITSRFTHTERTIASQPAFLCSRILFFSAVFDSFSEVTLWGWVGGGRDIKSVISFHSAFTFAMTNAALL